jgi:hypothetical protein
MKDPKIRILFRDGYNSFVVVHHCVGFYYYTEIARFWHGFFSVNERAIDELLPGYDKGKFKGVFL